MEPYTISFSHGSTSLNAEQYKVVTSPLSENQRILASAGSGKTTTITARIAYLLQHYDIQPHRILLVTFSRSAANEMRERVIRLIGPQPIYCGTFHALASQILRDNDPKSLKDQPFIDELPYRLVAWLQTEKGIKWALQFKAIIVDEFQDINQVQWQLLRLLHHRWATMAIVGDDAQNIYTWRGSSVDFILNFHNHVKGVQDYQLCKNYRSTEAIVTVANSVMRFIPTLPYKQKMVAHTKGGQKPSVHFFFRGSDEYDWIVNQIEAIYRLQTRQTFAIISRYNHDLYKIEERLHKRGIMYTLCTKYDPERSKSHARRVTLATVHASKGLEWDTVYFMNLHDDVFPSRKTDADIISERRLFYVGVTRAKTDLVLTYSKHERSLCRFVREIPRPFLMYHNISAFKLSTNEGSAQILSLADMITGFDGDDWHRLRSTGQVPSLVPTQRESIYGFAELFSVPEFVKDLDIRETWLYLVRWIFLRQAAVSLDCFTSLRTTEVDEMLLTLRIYKEDIIFWLEYEVEMEHLVYHFLKHTLRMPAVEYAELETYIAETQSLKHLQWTTQQLVQAVMILSKIRGQLRPLRHGGFDLTEFRFANVRNSVPTELRPFVLHSWHTIISPDVETHALLADLWYIASLSSVAEGRNIPLYQYHEVLPYLVQSDMQILTHAIERAVQQWIPTLPNATLCVRYEPPVIPPIHFDILTDTSVYQLYFDASADPSADDKIILLLKIYLYTLEFPGISAFGFVNSATGAVYTYSLTKEVYNQAQNIWEHIKRKYNI